MTENHQNHLSAGQDMFRTLTWENACRTERLTSAKRRRTLEQDQKAMSGNDDEIIDVEIVEAEYLPDLSGDEESTLPGIDTTQITKWSERWWALQAPHTQARRCAAHKKTGEQCGKYAIQGATVCRTHGGATKHIRQAARARLENAADRMAKQLLGIATDDNVAPETRLKAIVNALDRTIGKAPTTVEIGPAKPFEEIFDAIGGSPTRDYDTPMEHQTQEPLPSPPWLPSASPHMDAETLEALRRNANTSGLGSDATGQFASSSRGGVSTEGDASAREAGGDERDRERQPQPGGPHITGMDAIRIANYTNAQIGALRPPKELESPHKRYRRP